MSMLSEQRRKTKWVINPTKKPLWSTDSSGIKFGKELMEKMGWSAGKGLGLNEQGIQEPLKVSFKNDTKGMGFKGNDNDWIEHQDEFNVLLNQLRGGEDASAIKNADEKNEIKSLEEKSKSSRARVHYQKFTRGKDLSRYSENDLACILGTGKTKKEKPEPEIPETTSKTENNCETSFGVTTINSGSIQDYFKKKWIFDKLKSNNSGSAMDDAAKDSTQNENCYSVKNGQSLPSDYEEPKPKKKKHKSSSDEALPPKENKACEFDNSENVTKEKKKKRKKKHEGEMDLSEEPAAKKRKEGGNDENTNQTPCEVSDLENKTLKKRNKDNLKLDIPVTEVDFKYNELKKEKKKAKRSSESPAGKDTTCTKTNSVTTSENVSIESEFVKKKNKKHRRDEHESVKDRDTNDYQKSISNQCNGCITETCSEIISTSGKKKKKDKTNRLDLQTLPPSDYTKLENTDLNGEDQNLDKEPRKKKKKKKERYAEEEKLDHSISEDTKISPKIGNTEETNEIENILEVKPIERKKKKKDKKEKSRKNKTSENGSSDSNQDEHSSNQNGASGMEDTLGKESIKEKKKRVELTQSKPQLKDSEIPECEEEGPANTDSLKTKKKKNKKKKLEENEEREKSNNTPEETAEVEKPKEEQITNGTGLDNNQISEVPHAKTEGERRIEKLQGSMFGTRVVSKYLPQQETSERVQQLLRWADFSEFKGSNLKDVEGYGRRKMYEKQSR